MNGCGVRRNVCGGNWVGLVTVGFSLSVEPFDVSAVVGRAYVLKFSSLLLRFSCCFFITVRVG